MAHLSDYAETNIIESIFRGAAFPVPSGTYIALFTADPTDANVEEREITTAQQPNYVRVDAAQGGAIATGWTAPANGVTTNAKALQFPAHNGTAPIVVTHIGVYDAMTGGNLLVHAALAATKTLQIGDVIAFPIGSMTFTAA